MEPGGSLVDALLGRGLAEVWAVRLENRWKWVNCLLAVWGVMGHIHTENPNHMRHTERYRVK